jgi:hypothetical protein
MRGAMGIEGMKRVGAFALVVFVCLAGVAASAQGASYKGHFKKLPRDSKLTFEVTKQDGKRWVSSVAVQNIPLDCEDGSVNLIVTGGFSESAVVHRDGTFELRKNDATGKGRLAGAVHRGKGEGTLKLSRDFGPPAGVCKSGKLHWVAKKK